MCYTVCFRSDECGVGSEGWLLRPFPGEDLRQNVAEVCHGDMFLCEAITDPLLKQYDVIIRDEVHECALSIDIIISMIREICFYRKGLKWVGLGLPSIHLLSKYISHPQFHFNNAARFSDDVFYTVEPEREVVVAAVKTAVLYESKSDILLFSIGEQEIRILPRGETYPSGGDAHTADRGVRTGAGGVPQGGGGDEHRGVVGDHHRDGLWLLQVDY